MKETGRGGRGEVKVGKRKKKDGQKRKKNSE